MLGFTLFLYVAFELQDAYCVNIQWDWMLARVPCRKDKPKLFHRWSEWVKTMALKMKSAKCLNKDIVF